VYDPSAGSRGERSAVDAARAAYVASRATTHHSTDALLRLQCASTRAARGLPAPPAAPDLRAVKDNMPPPPKVVTDAMRAGLGFYQTLQADDGHFPGDYGGPMFLMPGLVIVCHVTGVMDTVLPQQHRAEMIRYLCNHANEDGGCVRARVWRGRQADWQAACARAWKHAQAQATLRRDTITVEHAAPASHA
jgi:cycloartenol synthase